MHLAGGESCMISNLAAGFRFRFLGGGEDAIALQGPVIWLDCEDLLFIGQHESRESN